MITKRDGDIFEATDLAGIIHQTNTFGVFGAGIAKAVADIYPEALDRSKEKCDELGSKALGTYDLVYVEDPGIYIINAYTQKGMGGPNRNTRYDVLADTLTDLRTELAELAMEGEALFKLGVPFGYGCGLAKGSWAIVEAIFTSVFGDMKDIEVVFVTNPKFAHTVKK